MTLVMDSELGRTSLGSRLGHENFQFSAQAWTREKPRLI